MQNHPQSNTFATGLAMFSMFFGAGNIIFPLALGQFAQDQNIYAIMGLLITAIGVPFAGLFAMTLFDGDYRDFFSRIGKLPGFFTAAIIMGLIGPFGAIPRCIALAYSTISAFLPGISIEVFSALSCLLIFLMTFKRNNIVDILGYFLTPILVGALAIIIIKGLLFSPETPPANNLLPGTAFYEGFVQGYQMMDLIGAFFFSSVIIVCLKKDLPMQEVDNHSRIMSLTMKSIAVAAPLLALTYIGFSFLAAGQSKELADFKSDELISQITVLVLGKHAGLIVSVAVVLACLTTAIALAAVFAEYLHEDITRFKIGYVPSLALTLVVTYFISILNFTMIIALLGPVLQVIYPALITLTICNILYKLYGF
ncbi:MAG: branched-chain amino acid transport system II carrier protein, partial [Parachlamydiaceae bacterium]|nr:branched-chain amino acid transport system II carrier protein [Parachlamydiaceae bacterium]